MEKKDSVAFLELGYQHFLFYVFLYIKIICKLWDHWKENLNEIILGNSLRKYILLLNTFIHSPIYFAIKTLTESESKKS